MYLRFLNIIFLHIMIHNIISETKLGRKRIRVIYSITPALDVIIFATRLKILG